MSSQCFDKKAKLMPNGDISGVGVLVGFMGTAYLAIIVLTVYYFLEFQPRKDPYLDDEELNTSPESTTAQAGDDIVPPRVGPSFKGPSISLNSIGSQSEAAAGSSPSPNPAPSIRSQSEPAAASSPSLNTPTSVGNMGEGGKYWNPNPMDVFVLENKLARWLLPRPMISTGENTLQDKVEKNFRRYMLGSCDIQIITGFGILISAFATLGGESGISAYHWQIAVYLAWFSNLTPLLGLTFLRQYLQKHPYQRYIRTIVMAMLTILLLAALFPTGWFDWAPYNPSSPPTSEPGTFARCYLDLNSLRLYRTSLAREGSAMLLSMSVLVFTFTARMIKMSQGTSRFIHLKVRGGARDFVVRTINFAWRILCSTNPRPNTLVTALIIQPMGSFLLTARLYADFYASTASDIWWAWAATAWVTLRIVQSKASAEVDEGALTFGQSIAVLLLVAPTIAAGVILWQIVPRWIKRQREQRPDSVDGVATSQHQGGTDPGTLSHPAHDATVESQFQQLSVYTAENELPGAQDLRMVLHFINNRSSAYAQPWYKAAIVLLWAQILLTTLSFMMMAGGAVEENQFSFAVFLLFASSSILLQHMNCSFLILLGIRSMSSKDTGTSRNSLETNSTWKTSRFFSFWQKSVTAWGSLVVALSGLLAITLPLHELMLTFFFFNPLILLTPWIFYHVYAFTRALISPTRSINSQSRSE